MEVLDKVAVTDVADVAEVLAVGDGLATTANTPRVVTSSNFSYNELHR